MSKSCCLMGMSVCCARAALAVTILAFGPPVSRAECPHGQPMKQLVAIPRGAIPFHEMWNMGADDMGIVGDQVHVRVSQQMLDQFTARGISFETLYADIDDAYDDYRRSLSFERAESFFDYHTYDSAVAAMERIVDEHPDIAALEIIGQSVEGRPILALRISDNAEVIEDDEPAILVDGCHHAREWIAVEVPLYYADYLTSNYRKIGAVTRLVNNAEVWVVPVLNPDGLVYTDTTDRWWRKNRRNNGDGTYGVDPNRNYSTGWGSDLGSSGETYSEVYRGPSPFSEPESRAIRDLMEGTLGRSFVTALSYHNYSQLVMYPNGYTTAQVDNVEEYERLGAEMTRLINDSHSDPRNDYFHGQISQLLYLASGGSSDWQHHAAGAIAFVIELRPAGPPFFELPPNEIVPTCQENLAAFLYLAEETLIPSLRPLDADTDGYLDIEDYCPNSPSEVIDDLGCASTEQDVDSDGIGNREDVCGNSLPGQQVDTLGCRVPALFGVDVVSNVAAVSITVQPPDIDARTVGDTELDGFRREFAAASTIELIAPRESNGNRFVRWQLDGVPQPDGAINVRVDASADVRAEAVFIYPTGVRIDGQRRLPDTREDGIGSLAQFGVEVVYNDGSAIPVSSVDGWTLGDEDVGSMTPNGQLLLYDVDAAEGEKYTTIQATAEYGGRRYESEPFRLSVFDQETKSPHCYRMEVTGPDLVADGQRGKYSARVWLDGEFDGRIVEDANWELLRADNRSTRTNSTMANDGTMTARLATGESSIVVRAAYINDDDTVCLGEKTVTVGARVSGDLGTAQGLNEGASATSGSTRLCGSVGLIGWWFAGTGLVVLRTINSSRRRS